MKVAADRIRHHHLECGLEGRIKGLELHVSALEERSRYDKTRIHQLERDLERSSRLVSELSRALDRAGADSVSSHESDWSVRKSLARKSSRTSTTSELIPIAQSMVPLEDEEDEEAQTSQRVGVQAGSKPELSQNPSGLSCFDLRLTPASFHVGPFLCFLDLASRLADVWPFLSSTVRSKLTL
jgi:hypothetical protein